MTTQTRSSPVPLTTPFVRPSSCGSGQFTTVTSMDSYATLIASDPKADSSCMPAGWDNAPEIIFSPAVCPEGWTMYNINPYGPIAGTCCSRGFTLASHYNPIHSTHTIMCAENLAITTTTTATPTGFNGTTRATPTGIRPTLSVKIHDPWIVEWVKFNIRSLTPAPPPVDFCTAVVIQSWVPGSTVDPAVSTPCPTEPPQDHLGDFLGPGGVLIWGPVLGVILFIAFGVTICCWQRKASRVVVVQAQPATNVAT